MPKTWEIKINRHRGLADKYYENSYSSFGDKGQANDMRNISLFDPNLIAPGPGMTALTGGTQAGAVTTLIKGMLRKARTTNEAYGVGGAKLYQLSATAVANAGIWPHTIDKGTVTGEDGEDVIHYKSLILYSYNHSGSAGDIGSYDLSTTFDDDYWTDTLGGTALASAPHQMIAGGDDIVYIANGQYIAYLDGTTDNAQGLDFPTGSVVNSLTWNNNRVFAAVNNPNISGANTNQSTIYKWNGYSSSWEGDPAEVNGRIGALYTKNGITYVWWEEYVSGTARLTFGILIGGVVQPLRTFSGTLPLYYQVGEMGPYVVWCSGQRVYAYGPVSGEVSAEMFQITSSTYATAGTLANPFGKLMLASNASTNYNLAVETDYATDSYYYTLLFPTSEGGRLNVMDYLEINFEKLTTGQRVDLTLKDSKGNSLWTDTISYTADGAVTKKIFNPRAEAENYQLQYSWANGQASSQIKIRSVVARGIVIPQ